MPTINRAVVVRLVGAVGMATALFTVGFEKFENGVYVDPVGHKAVCVGRDSTGPDGKPLRLGTSYTDDVCSYMLGQDIHAAQSTLAAKAKVPLSEGEQIAYTDFIFNVGSGAFAGSTLLQKLNAGDHKGACNELLRWVKGKVNGRPVSLPGLVKRRAAEQKVCLG